MVASAIANTYILFAMLQIYDANNGWSIFDNTYFSDMIVQKTALLLSLCHNTTTMKDVFTKIFIFAIFFTATVITCVAIISISYQVSVRYNQVW